MFGRIFGTKQGALTAAGSSYQATNSAGLQNHLATQQQILAQQQAQYIGYASHGAAGLGAYSTTVPSAWIGQMSYPVTAPAGFLGGLPNAMPTNLSNMRDLLLPAVDMIVAKNGSAGSCVSIEVDNASDCLMLNVDGVKTVLLTRREMENNDYQHLVGPRLIAAISKPLPKAIHAGEITAWRVWLWNGSKLKSTAMDFFWEPREIIKADGPLASGHGIHCWRDKEDAIRYSLEWTGGLTAIVGQIEIWGEVIGHEAGYRAEFAKIVAIDSSLGETLWPWQLKAIRKQYLEETKT